MSYHFERWCNRNVNAVRNECKNHFLFVRSLERERARQKEKQKTKQKMGRNKMNGFGAGSARALNVMRSIFAASKRQKLFIIGFQTRRLPINEKQFVFWFFIHVLLHSFLCLRNRSRGYDNINERKEAKIEFNSLFLPSFFFCNCNKNGNFTFIFFQPPSTVFLMPSKCTFLVVVLERECFLFSSSIVHFRQTVQMGKKI